MKITQRHVTPDGLLTLLSGTAESGDITVGFEGYQWHTHGDLLSHGTDLSLEAATQKFILDVVNDRLVIVVSKVEGRIREVWITDAPYYDKYKPESEVMEFRYWSGKVLVTPSS